MYSEQQIYNFAYNDDDLNLRAVSSLPTFPVGSRPEAERSAQEILNGVCDVDQLAIRFKFI